MSDHESARTRYEDGEEEYSDAVEHPEAGLPLLAENLHDGVVDRIAGAGVIVLDEDPDGPQVEADPTPVRSGREPAPELDDRFKTSPLLYPNGTYATIKVRDGAATAWPVVERAQGAWQSSAHRYPDSMVESVRVLPVNGQVVLTEEMVEIAVAGIVGSSWKFRGPEAQKATLEDGYTALQAMLAAEPVTVPRKDPDAPRWADLWGIDPNYTEDEQPAIDRDAVVKLRTDLHESYPRRAQYDIPSTVIDRLDAILGDVDHG